MYRSVLQRGLALLLVLLMLPSAVLAEENSSVMPEKTVQQTEETLQPQISVAEEQPETAEKQKTVEEQPAVGEIVTEQDAEEKKEDAAEAEKKQQEEAFAKTQADTKETAEPVEAELEEKTPQATVALSAEPEQEAVLQEEVAEIPDTRMDGQVMTYYLKDGTTSHQIYWAKGVNPPKMTVDSKKLGTDGYFTQVETAGVLNYLAPFQLGNGYYDLNKRYDQPDNNEVHYCYLVAAADVIYWWMDQNKENIKLYQEEIAKGNFLQDVNPATPYDKLLGYPPDSLLSESELGTVLKRPFVGRDQGFYEGPVLDYFFNGYDPLPQGDKTNYPLNQPETYQRDRRGGYFYPIFGRERLITAYGGSVAEDRKRITYDFLNTTLKNAFSEGKGVTLSYTMTSNAHAIAVWGAEYDEKGNLCRIFYTDSDDGSYPIGGVDGNAIAGMRSVAVVKRDNGLAGLDDSAAPGNNTNPNPEPGKVGAYVSSIVLLDPKTEAFAAALKDTEKPAVPTLRQQPQDAEYAKGAPATALQAIPQEDGNARSFFTYQWYRTDQINAEGKPIAGETRDSYQPITDFEPGTMQYYYCVITNNKNGDTEETKSDVATITINEKPLVHAAEPKVVKGLKSGVYKKNQSVDFTLQVEAESKDGGTISYQWYQVPGDIANNPAVKLENETQPSLKVPTDDIGSNYYYCEITNTNQTVTGRRQTTVRQPQNNGFVRVNVVAAGTVKAPVIEAQPVAQTTYIEKAPAKALSVKAKTVDDGVLSYQWYQTTQAGGEGQAIPDAKQAVYTPTTDKTGTFYYYCIVTNTVGDTKATAKTAVAKVEVHALKHAQQPVIITQPQDAYYKKGEQQAAVLSVTASNQGEGALSYQWYQAADATEKGGPVGENQPIYHPQTKDTGIFYYYCEITNTDTRAEITGEQQRTVTSARAKVEVHITNTIVVQNELQQQMIDTLPQEIRVKYPTVQKVEAALKEVLMVEQNQLLVKDITLEIVEPDGSKRPARADEIPADGITVYIPYPADTNMDTHIFMVSHLITTGPRAGEIETPLAENTKDGIKVTFSGLSPVAISWKAVPTEEKPTPIVPPEEKPAPSAPPTEKPAPNVPQTTVSGAAANGKPNPPTGVFVPEERQHFMGTALAVIVLFGMGAAVLAMKKKNKKQRIEK